MEGRPCQHLPDRSGCDAEDGEANHDVASAVRVPPLFETLRDSAPFHVPYVHLNRILLGAEDCFRGYERLGRAGAGCVRAGRRVTGAAIQRPDHRRRRTGARPAQRPRGDPTARSRRGRPGRRHRHHRRPGRRRLGADRAVAPGPRRGTPAAALDRGGRHDPGHGARGAGRRGCSAGTPAPWYLQAASTWATSPCLWPPASPCCAAGSTTST
jgi:hypothetical protein